MTKTAQQPSTFRGRGLLSATGPQTRFILFLVFLLIAFTVLLRVFQKLAAIVSLPVFLPVALLSLLAFIGIAGALYSHKFVGPLIRIRKTLDQIAHGECAVTLRLREADDPALKELVQSITQLCENSRNARHAVQEAANGLFAGLAELRESARQEAPAADIGRQLEALRTKQELLETALRAMVR